MTDPNRFAHRELRRRFEGEREDVGQTMAIRPGKAFGTGTGTGFCPALRPQPDIWRPEQELLHGADVKPLALASAGSSV